MNSQAEIGNTLKRVEALASENRVCDCSMSSPLPSSRPQALTALRAIARALSAAWDLDTTLDLIARKTTEVMAVDSCTIYLPDPDGRTLRLRATTGLARRALGRATLQVGEGMTGYAVESGRPIHAA